MSDSLKLPYKFSNESLLGQALTHRSFSADHNERLEFLGDSLLNYIIAEALYLRFPKAREGDLSRLRSKLVKGETLAELAVELQLGPAIRLGSGERKSGGEQRESILADAVEAVIAAIFLDSNFDQCRTVVLQWFQTRLDKLNLQHSYKDAKSTLQELLQARRMPLPVYQLLKKTGMAHQQEFVISCELKELNLVAVAGGRSRKIAEQKAAADLVSQIEKNS